MTNVKRKKIFIRWPSSLWRRLGNAVRRNLAACQPGVELGTDVVISRAVRIVVTDGGRLSLESTVTLDDGAAIFVKCGALRIGQGSHVGIGAVLCAREQIDIGENTLISEYVTIRDQDHVYDGDKPTAKNGFVTAPIVIGKNVWIGAKATVTKGVRIGDNTVIGANAVVTRDLPENVLAVGVPAHIVKTVHKE